MNRVEEGHALKLPLLVRVWREIGGNDSHVHAVGTICFNGIAVLAAPPSPIAVVIVAPRGWFDRVLHA